MTLIELMRKLQKQYDQHGGDIDVVLYDNGTQQAKGEHEITDYDIEYNTDDEEPVVLISF